MMLIAHTPRAEGSMFASARSIGYPASFGYASRHTAAQNGACDMDSLKMAISHAIPGTGQVKQAITDATFVLRAPAVNSLIRTCAKCRQVQKAIEVFDTMANSEAIVVKPNTVHYRYATGTFRDHSECTGSCTTCRNRQQLVIAFRHLRVTVSTIVR